MRPTIQDSFDRHANWRTKQNGKKNPPKAVTSSITMNVVCAVQSLTQFDPGPDAVPPYRLDSHDWQPGDTLVVHNGILNLREYVGGRDYFLPLTPKLFYETRCRFDYAPENCECPEWDSFRASLEQDSLLQEIMGYWLWYGYELQRIFMLVGATRSGKGVITRVCTGLVGGDSAVCGLELRDLITDFGLEPALGKRLAIFGDIDMPAKGEAAIIAKLKAITGGDLVQVNRKDKHAVSVRLGAKPLMLSNMFFPLPDNSGALHARTVPLVFTKSFAGSEDPTLEERLIDEYPAILNWALARLKRLWESGGVFTMPESTSAYIRQVEDDVAPLKAFVRHCCVCDPGQAVRSQAHFSIYRWWHTDNERCEPLMSKTVFEKQLRAAAPGVQSKRMTRPWSTHQDGALVRKTAYDSKASRPLLWVGIAPIGEHLLS